MNHYILANGRIIDVITGEIFKGALEIKDGHILKIFPGEVDRPNQKVLDVNGRYILPGLIDMHCHINEPFARQFIASGVTTVRNTGGQGLKQLEKLLTAPKDAPTPRVYAADRLIDGPPGLWGPTSEGNFVTDDPYEAREEVKRQAAAGTKFIKVYGLLPKHVMAAVADEARKHDLEVSCDLIHSSQVNALEAAEMGITWFEHASGFIQALYPGWFSLDDKNKWQHINWQKPDQQKITELCQQMLAYDVKICPTLLINDQIDRYPDYWNPNNIVTKSLPDGEGLMKHWHEMENHAETFKEQLGFQNNMLKAITKAYFELGGTVVAGTDTPAGLFSFPGMGLHRELELFVEIGMTELEAIQAATIKAAQAIHLDEIGVIEEGKIADLLILDKHPLEEIKHTKDIHLIVKGGKIYSQGELLEVSCHP